MSFNLLSVNGYLGRLQRYLSRSIHIYKVPSSESYYKALSSCGGVSYIVLAYILYIVYTYEKCMCCGPLKKKDYLVVAVLLLFLKAKQFRLLLLILPILYYYVRKNSSPCSSLTKGNQWIIKHEWGLMLS